MYKNTTYKAFVANTAAQLMTEMVSQKLFGEKINLNTSFGENKEYYEHLTDHAIGAAVLLANRLVEWWEVKGYNETTFFDPEDTLNTGIENGLDRIVEQLDRLNDNVDKL